MSKETFTVCDRCDKSEKSHPQGWRHFIEKSERNYRVTLRHDLCDTCVKDFYTFMVGPDEL